MLSYVWDDIKLFNHGMVGVKDNFSAAEILADLFLFYADDYIKKGVIHEYIEREEEIRGIKGKINFDESLKNLSLQNAKIICDYDEYSSNTVINQIIKSTAMLIYRSTGLLPITKNRLNCFLLKLNNVELIELSNKTFQLMLNRHTQKAKQLLDVCELIFNQIVVSSEYNEIEFLDIFDNEHEFAKLFEKFVYKFYKTKSNKKVVYQKVLKWNVEGENVYWLPQMEIDIFIEDDKKVYIIDTKYSTHFYSSRVYDFYTSEKLIASHLYQINSYLSNYQSHKIKNAVLVYPKPYSEKMVDLTYYYNETSGNDGSQIRIKTIDLESDWQTIEEQLMMIIQDK